MQGNTIDWWGFRLRIPSDYDPKPCSRIELVVFFLVIGMVIQLLWLIFLLYAPLEHFFFININILLQSIWKPLKYTIVVPVTIFLFFIALGRFLPIKWIQSTWIGAVIVMSREHGNLKKWDLCVLAIGSAGLLLSIFRLEFHLMVTEMAILVKLIIISIGFTMFQERVNFANRRWQIEVPEWLRNREDGNITGGDGGTDASQSGVIQPEKNARPIFEFGYGKRKFQIGINISETLIQFLRNLNKQYSNPGNNDREGNHGFLYHDYPTEIIHMDKSPVDIPDAKKKIEILCHQIISIAEELRITRFQLATAVLNWVQANFAYELDEESTKDFPGGPYSEYGRFALETIYDGVGDCECTTLLCVTLLTHLGFDTAILHLKITDPATQVHTYHAAVGLEGKGLFLPDDEYYKGYNYIQHETAKGKKYLYGETATDSERAFGVIPDCWKDHMVVHRIDHINADNRFNQNR